MTKAEWLEAELKNALPGTENFWPTGSAALRDLVAEKGERLTRLEFRGAMLDLLNHCMSKGIETDDTVTAWDHFARFADYSKAWDTSSSCEFPQLPLELIQSLPDAEKFVQVGGEPTWIQDPQPPICRRCDRDMALVFQLGSLPKDVRDRDERLAPYHFADSGIHYLFGCKDCGEYENMLQYY